TPPASTPLCPIPFGGDLEHPTARRGVGGSSHDRGRVDVRHGEYRIGPGLPAVDSALLLVVCGTVELDERRDGAPPYGFELHRADDATRRVAGRCGRIPRHRSTQAVAAAARDRRRLSRSTT